jgi:hypothetical protein
MMHTPAFHELLRAVTGDDAYRRLGKLATNAGMTTIGDLAAMSIMDPSSIETPERIVNADGYPVRIVQYPLATIGGAAAANDNVVEASTV